MSAEAFLNLDTGKIMLLGETVRRGYAAFNSGDMKTLTEVFHENASWHTPGRGPLAGDRKGRDAAFAHFGRYAGDTGGTFRAVLQSVGATDDGLVVAIHHNTAKRNVRQLNVGCCLVFEFKDGQISGGREHFSTSTPGTSSGRSPDGLKILENGPVRTLNVQMPRPSGHFS